MTSCDSSMTSLKAAVPMVLYFDIFYLYVLSIYFFFTAFLYSSASLYVDDDDDDDDDDNADDVSVRC